MTIKNMINLQARCFLHYEFDQPTNVIFMLRPRSTQSYQSHQSQWIINQRFHITPKPTLANINEYSDIYGNICQRTLLPQGVCTVESVIEVSTTACIDLNLQAMATPILQLPAYVMMYLLPSRYCHPEMMLSQSLEITQNFSTDYEKAQAICEYIHQNFVYEYGSSDNNTTALDAWQNKKGVCRDFSHVGISLCRALDMPARMVVGYLHGLEPMDLHAWYEVFIGGHWYTFDATQNAPKGGRIILAFGRDAADVAFATFFDGFMLKDMQVSVTAI